MSAITDNNKEGPVGDGLNNNNPGVISMHDFLDFLKLACQVNESIAANRMSSEKMLDFNQLSRNELVNSLMSRAKSSSSSSCSPAKTATAPDNCPKGYTTN